MQFWNLIAASIGPLWLMLVVVVLLLLVSNLILQRRLARLEQSYRNLTQGTEGGNLHQVLAAHVNNVQKALSRIAEAEATVKALQTQSPAYLQHLGIVRFNPFQSMGSDQSFSLVIADKAGNGVIITSLHNRDGTRLYAKPLAAWNSTYTLTDEEQQAIRRSRGEKE